MVHAYKNNGYNIVLDVNSGSVHVVDDVVYDLIPVVEEILCGKFGTAAAPENVSEWEQLQLQEELAEQILKNSNLTGSEDIQEAIEEILELRAAGLLYTDDIFKVNSSAIFPSSSCSSKLIKFFFKISFAVSIRFEDSTTSHFFAYSFASVVYLESVIKNLSFSKFKNITLSHENLHSKYIAFSF